MHEVIRITLTEWLKEKDSFRNHAATQLNVNHTARKNR